MGRVKRSGPPHFPSFTLAPTLRVRVFTLPSLHHNKDGSYNSTNINKQLSPSKNTLALQAITLIVNSSTLLIMIHYYVLIYRLEL